MSVSRRTGEVRMTTTKGPSSTKNRAGVSPAQGFALIRIAFGLVYLSNAIAKLTSVSDVRLGPVAGSLITRDGARGILERATEDTWWPALGSFYRHVVLTNWDFFSWLLTFGELAIAIGLLFGIASRLAALGALLLITPIWVLVMSQGSYLWTYPVELLPLLILAIAPSGRALGLDHRLADRFGSRWPF
jgi:uncharacterized membrane protein YphA (DoxX/SURF4 family)